MVVVIDKLDLATAACDEVRESSRFRRMMRDVILQVGNQLNAGSARGAAVGFKLASLGALNISGFDGTPLMRFIIENLMKAQSPVRCVLIVRLVYCGARCWIDVNFCQLLHFDEELPHVQGKLGGGTSHILVSQCA